MHILRSTALSPQIKVSRFGVLLTLFVAAAAKRRLQSAESHDVDEARQVTPCANTMQLKGGFRFPSPLVFIYYGERRTIYQLENVSITETESLIYSIENHSECGLGLVFGIFIYIIIYILSIK